MPVNVTIEGPTHGAGAAARAILEALPAWFGIASAVTAYVAKTDTLPTWIARNRSGAPIGFIAVELVTDESAEVHVIGVLPAVHRQGIGQRLVEHAAAWARRQHRRFLIVKTLSATNPDPNYARTRRFYDKAGFLPLDELPTLWSATNPCLLMAKPLVQMPPFVRGYGDDDADAVARALVDAFEGEDEAALVKRLQAGTDLCAAWVAAVRGEVVGCLFLSHLQTAAGGLQAWALAPVAVATGHQRRGVGAAMIRTAMSAAREAGCDVVVVLGDPVYYARFGFSTTLGQRVACPYSGPYLMALELRPGALATPEGIAVTYPPAFAAME